MRLHLTLAAACTMSALCASAQNDPVLLTVDKQDVRVSEFSTVYKKNNKDAPIDRADLENYLDLYINFKLKVREAEALGMDTVKKFRDELKGYQKQLAKPYLTDKEVTEALVKEAYDRMKEDVRASHILIKVSPDALPKDTLTAYNKVMDLRKQVEKGAKFEDLAKKYSEDPSAKENSGDLGYFTSLRMVYPFENAAYSTPVGKMSMPVRTRFGYHLIKVTDRRPAQGEVLAAHIMIKTGAEATDEQKKAAKDKIMEVKGMMANNAKFEDLAVKYSEDKGSARNGGQLPWFGAGRMVPAFENAAFALANNGDVSEPIETSYGWHIIKRIDRRGVQAFAEIEKDLRAKVAKDSRSQKSEESVLARIRKEYGFKENTAAVNELLPLLTDSILEGKWDPSVAKNMTKTVFSIGTQNYTQRDLADYMGRSQVRRTKDTLAVVLNGFYSQYVKESLLNYEEARLEQKYPEYRALLKEYRDGILLFDLTDQKVWTKAVKDTVGLEKYYNGNKQQFMWKDRADAEIYHCMKDSIVAPLKPILEKKLKKGEPSREDIIKQFNTDSQLNLRAEGKKYEKDEEDILSKAQWAKGLYGPIEDSNNKVYILIKEILPPQPKTLKEAKGLVTAEYQTYLEREWIKELRGKYKVEAHPEHLDLVK
jgi:peptidyl-prolyl cis-trans isomerase SurA